MRTILNKEHLGIGSKARGARQGFDRAALWMALVLLSSPGFAAECGPDEFREAAARGEDTPCREMETVTIFGVAQDPRNVAGGASRISPAELESFATTDVMRALQRVPGASFQLEDGFGLRPNISIRGTPTERSSRITLLEDNVLIAPAPYAAPAAYYFPTFGRIESLEVMKGPAAITQGPYTIGGAINLVSTPIPAQRGGLLRVEGGSDSTWRTHAWYGDSGERVGWLLETHQWRSDGFQRIDHHRGDTGLQKADYVARFSLGSDPAAEVFQRLEIKVQKSDEESNQTYLGLTDADFRSDALRRYGVSALDNMDNDHEQLMARWSLEPGHRTRLDVTAYHNEFERAWYKTEGIDFDGSLHVGEFQRTSWASVIEAVNLGRGLGGLTARQLQAILDGGDTPAGAIQVRNNARSYFSRGIQADLSHQLDTGRARHTLQFGIRWHEDEEDRLQRNDTFQQLDGALVISALGREGDAGNRIQAAEAWALYIQDRLELGRWTLTPGLRLESIRQSRIDYGADPDDPAGRGPGDVKGRRENSEDVLIPGLGVIYDWSARTLLVAGVHKGFSAPGNKAGIDPEESINYEAGLRYSGERLDLEVMAFFNDYDNLQGVCTASSGSDCEVGDVFNGDAVRIPGLEVQLQYDFSRSAAFRLPFTLSYTWMNAEFESDIADSEFFGDVYRGDPVPYIPDHQAFLSLGLERDRWSTYLSASHNNGVCTQARCGTYEKTDSSTVLDLAVHYRLNGWLELYGVVENLSRELDIVARQPYGARPGKSRAWVLGARMDF